VKKRKAIVRLVNNINFYFPEGSLSIFEIFLPSKLPKTEADVFTYGSSEISDLAERFEISRDILLMEWRNVLSEIIKSLDFPTMQNVAADKHPERFWSFYLKARIPWGSTIRLIHIVMVLPSSSADAERSFSVLNQIRYIVLTLQYNLGIVFSFHMYVNFFRSSRRTSLTSQHLDDFLRIRLNGPKVLSQFSASRYSKIWLQKGHLRTDNPTQIRARLPEEPLVDDFEELHEDETDGTSYYLSLFSQSSLF